MSGVILFHYIQSVVYDRVKHKTKGLTLAINTHTWGALQVESYWSIDAGYHDARLPAILGKKERDSTSTRCLDLPDPEGVVNRVTTPNLPY